MLNYYYNRDTYLAIRKIAYDSTLQKSQQITDIINTWLQSEEYEMMCKGQA